MALYAESLQNLIDALNRLPGIGPKSAERLAFHIVKMRDDDRKLLTKHILEVKDRIKKCAVCGQWNSSSPCKICLDEKRDRTLIGVVAETQDLAAIERTGEFWGVYHVLGGVLNPLTGVTADDLNINGLLNRIKNSEPPIVEVIFALNPDVEGETTILYLAKLLRPLKIKLSRLARGLPLGADLEYADEVTLGDALKGRRSI
ncbi:recombination protein RecR [Candidatus Parcubacteria bacterium]|jgi:recombination protein RecR|nr:MAG: recombination protein RecR [Candidatus Parcubacteria bacterium]